MSYLFGYILSLFLISIFFRVDFFFYVLYLLFGIFAFSRVWTEQILRHLDLRRDYVDRAFPGERVDVKLEIRNRGLLPVPWLRIHDSLPLRLKSPAFYQSVLSLLPFERRELCYELHCRRRGHYHLGPLVVSTGELFGAKTQELNLLSSDTLTVYPRIIPLTHLGLPAQAPFGDLKTNQRIFEDPARIIGVRDYQSGDSLRHIHWGASAQTARLQVKRFEPAISIESQILLNLNRDDYTTARLLTASELAIVAAASIANHLVEKRQAVGLVCNGLDPLLDGEEIVSLPPKKSRAQLMAILEVLARIEPGQETPFEAVLRRAPLQLGWGATAIVITSVAGDALFDRLLLMKRAGLHAVLILVDPRARFSETRRLAEQAGIKAYQLWQELDLDIWRAQHG